MMETATQTKPPEPIKPASTLGELTLMPLRLSADNDSIDRADGRTLASFAFHADDIVKMRVRRILVKVVDYANGYEALLAENEELKKKLAKKER